MALLPLRVVVGSLGFLAAAAFVPFTKIPDLKLLSTKLTELPVSNKALTRVLFNLIDRLGRRGKSSLHGTKQADMTAQKLMIADGREVELGLVFLRSFPPLHLLDGAPVSLLR